VRGIRLSDGQVSEFCWLTSSTADRKLEFGIPLPCVPGLVIHFSANDGRVKAADHTAAACGAIPLPRLARSGVKNRHVLRPVGAGLTGTVGGDPVRYLTEAVKSVA
jgi:hypothetical protein